MVKSIISRLGINADRKLSNADGPGLNHILGWLYMLCGFISLIGCIGIALSPVTTPLWVLLFFIAMFIVGLIIFRYGRLGEDVKKLCDLILGA